MNMQETQQTWTRFEQSLHKNKQISISKQISKSPPMQNLLKTFASIIASFFICRDYESVDPWGKRLNLLDCILRKEYKLVEYQEGPHSQLLEVEDNIQAQVHQANKDALKDWLAIGGEASRRLKPKNKIPNRPAIIGENTPWGDSLGKDNEAIETILQKPAKIRNSWLSGIIMDVCHGSAKMAHVLKMIRNTARESTVMPDPFYPKLNKYYIITNIRLCKAIVYAWLAKEFGKDSIAWVGEGVDKDTEVLKWRQYYDSANNTINDKVYIMVAGLKMVCQLIDLVEGHVFEGLEPHPINAEVVQYGYRGYRISQKAPVVTVNWLVHHDSYVESYIHKKNMMKDNFTSECKAVEIHKVSTMNRDDIARMQGRIEEVEVEDEDEI
ncbi:MAG: hypothetical protein Q9180_007082 [Flavoplaca navasiana]